jgi:hypothetical protein
MGLLGRRLHRRRRADVGGQRCGALRGGTVGGGTERSRAAQSIADKCVVSSSDPLGCSRSAADACVMEA